VSAPSSVFFSTFPLCSASHHAATPPRRTSARPCARLGVSLGGKDPSALPLPCLKQRRYPLPRRHVGASAAPTNQGTCRVLDPAPTTRGRSLSQAKSHWGFPLSSVHHRGRRGEAGKEGLGAVLPPTHHCWRTPMNEWSWTCHHVRRGASASGGSLSRTGSRAPPCTYTWRCLLRQAGDDYITDPP
jgi:hypothetical protein